MDPTLKRSSLVCLPKHQSNKPEKRIKYLPQNRFGWYRVHVYRRFVSKKKIISHTLLNELKDLCHTNNIRWNPYYLEEGDEQDVTNNTVPSCTFYVNDYSLAKALQRMNVPPKCLLRIAVTNKLPQVRVDPNFWEKLCLAIRKRYKPSEESLDLYGFYKDDMWMEEFCSLDQKNCMSAAIRVMELCMPNLRSLILDNNCLTDLSAFRGIEIRLPKLVFISLANNDLRNVETFQVFNNLYTTQIDVSNNPIDSPFKRRQLLKLLPKLILLDNKHLRVRSPPKMKFMLTLDETALKHVEEQVSEPVPEEIPNQVPESEEELEMGSKMELEEPSEEEQSTTGQHLVIPNRVSKFKPELDVIPEIELENVPAVEKDIPKRVPNSKEEPTEKKQPKAREYVEKESPKEVTKCEEELNLISKTELDNEPTENRQPKSRKHVEKEIPKQLPNYKAEPNPISKNELKNAATEKKQPKTREQVEKEIPKQVTKSKEELVLISKNELKNVPTENEQPKTQEHVEKESPKQVPKSKEELVLISKNELKNVPTENEQPKTQEHVKKEIQKEVPKSKEELNLISKNELKSVPTENEQTKTREQVEKEIPKQVPKSKEELNLISKIELESVPTENEQTKTREQVEKEIPKQVPKSKEELNLISKIELENLPTERNQLKTLDIVLKSTLIPTSAKKSNVVPEVNSVQQYKLLRRESANTGYDDLQRFLNSYIKTYDFDRQRSGLKWFYQETALISFTKSQYDFAICLDSLADQDNKYFSRYKDGIKIENRDSALAHFASLPKSQHLLPTIVVDLMMMQPDRVFFTISGFLKDLTDGSIEPPPMRYFIRSFILTPMPDTPLEYDFRISSEIIYICDASPEQLKAGVVPALHSQSDFMSNIVERLLPDIVGSRRLQQADLIVRLSKHTNLKWEWSHMCLIECHWDFSLSLKIVRKMQGHNLIPKKAFLQEPGEKKYNYFGVTACNL
ncbi:nuclear RNA export factor 1-like [Drosophila innubila]|uniref:nuclear RNA export factor 1-like n=1 Tax=Drosophila innubila TaxID=198719 RepID=UPI00148B6BA8|nr:nuclear RNA export factor 1-like [Drosophila innubila]